MSGNDMRCEINYELEVMSCFSGVSYLVSIFLFSTFSNTVIC